MTLWSWIQISSNSRKVTGVIVPREDTGITPTIFSEEYEVLGDPIDKVELRGNEDSVDEVASEFANLKVYRGFMTEAEVGEPCMIPEFPSDPEDPCWGDVEEILEMPLKEQSENNEISI